MGDERVKTGKKHGGRLTHSENDATPTKVLTTPQYPASRLLCVRWPKQAPTTGQSGGILA